MYSMLSKQRGLLRCRPDLLLRNARRRSECAQGKRRFLLSQKPSQIPLVNGRNTRTFGILNLAPRPYHEQADDIKIMVTLPRLPWHGSLCLTR
jgi:hypothetical protein